MKVLLMLACLLPFGMFSCNSSRNMVTLADVKWELASMEGKEIQIKEGAVRNVFIQFDEKEKRASGMAGCNRFFGGYEMDGSKLKFSHMGATRMACPEMNVETAFFKVLEDTDNYIIKEHQLILRQKDKVLAVFKSSGRDGDNK